MKANLLLIGATALTMAALAETTSENTQADQGRPLAARKGYWAFYAWSKLARLGTQVAVTTEGLGDHIYAVAATDAKGGRVGIFVVRYMEQTEDEYVLGPKPVTVALARGSLAGAQCHLTDTPMTYSEFEPETLTDGSLVFMLEPQSFVYIEKALSETR